MRAVSAALLLALVGCGSAHSGATSSAVDSSAATSDATGDATDVAADRQAGPLCNGAAASCERTLSQVCLAGAHNAMSSAAEGWNFPNQNVAFPALLDLGIRALLLDIHRWDDPEDDGTAADAGPELWLCHGNCVLGHRRLADALADLRSWLDAHPRDLVFVVFEDAVGAADVKAALKAAALVDRAAKLDPAALPTLGAMLDAGIQVVWTAEQKGEKPDGAAFYLDVWALVQDTPYTFKSMAEIDRFEGAAHACRVNRGQADAPLLQVNHWVAKVLPAAALSAEANTLERLLARAAACEALRGQKVNLLVVDHADSGEVVRACRILDGLEARP
ncbi:MAG: hypothetical protein H6747_03255 [Deltaproteobacteria bacterium]|nr:hypothetical protein [Deltaproteobacteria bacterium]